MTIFRAEDDFMPGKSDGWLDRVMIRLLPVPDPDRIHRRAMARKRTRT